MPGLLALPSATAADRGGDTPCWLRPHTVQPQQDPLVPVADIAAAPISQVAQGTFSAGVTCRAEAIALDWDTRRSRWMSSRAATLSGSVHSCEELSIDAITWWCACSF